MNRQYGVRGALRNSVIAAAVYLSGCGVVEFREPEHRETEHVTLEGAGKTPDVTFEVLKNINRYIERQEKAGSLHVQSTNKEEDQINNLLREETSLRDYLRLRVGAIKRAIDPEYKEPDVAAVDKELEQTQAVLAQVPGVKPSTPEQKPVHNLIFNKRYDRLSEKEKNLLELRQEITTLLGEHQGLVDGLGSYGTEAKRRLETYLEGAATEWKTWTGKTNAPESPLQKPREQPALGSQ